MIEMQRAQSKVGDGLIAEEVSDLREDLYAARASMERWRNGTPRAAAVDVGRADRRGAAVGPQAIRNWSYEVLQREVRANLVYRASPVWVVARHRTHRRWALGVALVPKVLKQIQERMVRIAHDNGVTIGRMRMDATVVDTNIHHRDRPILI
jgi:IS5 family transposase